MLKNCIKIALRNLIRNKVFSTINIVAWLCLLWNLAPKIGVRKVLGASVLSVVGLLSKDFLKLVIYALLIALPLSAYFMNQWLSDFPFRIDI